MLKDINLDILINDPDERKNDKNLLVFFISIFFKKLKIFQKKNF